MSRDNYTGLPPALKQAVFTRDNWRCRWCGATNAYGYDVHHIQYRRGYAYDVIDNLVTLCRGCHNFVHDSYSIPKGSAQEVLSRLVSDEGRGVTGLALWRHSTETDNDSDVHLDRATGPVGRLLREEDSRGVGPIAG
jgi:hypothetical protein